MSPLKQDAGGDAAPGTAGGSGSAGAGSPGTGGTSGAAGAGTAGASGAGGAGTAGASGAGGAGTAGASGAGGAGGSLGSVTLRLSISPGQSFCDQGCGSPNHISILDGAGNTLQIYAPACSTVCSECKPVACPAIACFPTGRAVQTSELVWNGTSTTVSTCGNKITCVQPGFAPAGHYVARMCATPGTLTAADAGPFSTCMATGPNECVDVPFDYPGPSSVTGTLP